MSNNKKVVLSGIRATGNLHLGNYFGALGKFVRMQDDFDCRFFIADLHALTTHPDPKMLHENVKQILAEYLAAGLDPDKNILYVQSDVPEISEMYLLMNMHAGIGELMRTASFKDKARKALGISHDGNNDEEAVEKEIIGNQSGKSVNAGLLTYPTLMAVDILIHHADFVPVGKDQEQHLELTRRFGRRFNAFYNTEYFHDPVNFNFDGKPVKVPGLDGSGKMGKSEGNCIYLVDDEKTLRKKVMRAVTADCSIRYGDLKKQLAEDILKITLPIRERVLEIRNDDQYLSRVVREGAERARDIAADTLRDVRHIMGIRKI